MMKLAALAYTSINQLSLIDLRLLPCENTKGQISTIPAAATERFVYITHGTVRFSLDAGDMYAGTWDMVYLPRNTAYHSKWLTDASFLVVDISLRDGCGQDICFGDAPCVLFHDEHHVYEGLLRELSDKVLGQGPFDWLERISLTFKLMCEIARDTNRNALGEKYSCIKQGITYLESNYSENFPIEELAKICSLSSAHFRRLFLECKGMSPVEYRNHLRMSHAIDLLKTGKFTVNQVAEQVGIRDVKYFSKVFQQHTGIRPGMLKNKGFTTFPDISSENSEE